MGEIVKSTPWEGSARLPNLPPAHKKEETLADQITIPRRGRQAPEDKLKALVDLEIRQGKLCA